MKHVVIALLCAASIAALVACNTTEGFVKDFSATVDTGKGLLGLSYDPTNGTVLTAPAQAFGTIKVHTLEK